MSRIPRRRVGGNPELKWLPSGPELVAALGGKSQDGKYPCVLPGHEGKRHLSIDLNKTTRNGEAVVHCWVSGNDHKDELVAILRERYGRVRERSEPVVRKKYRAEVEGKPAEKKDTFPGAEALWAVAAESKEQPVEYLRGRKITLIPDGVKLVSRTEVGKIAREFPELWLKSYPTMVVRVVDETGKMIGAETTALSFDADEKLDDTARKTCGQKKGGYVVLGEPDPNLPLIIAEGVESALSAAQLTGVGGSKPYPAIATLGTEEIEIGEAAVGLGNHYRRRQR